MSLRRTTHDQTFAGVFLIGLAILFLTGFWWPGIMFVLGIAMIARAINEGRAWNDDRNALVLLGIGVIFTLTDVINIRGGALWPLILIALGVYLLFGKNLPGLQRADSDKAKHDDLP